MIIEPMKIKIEADITDFIKNFDTAIAKMKEFTDAVNEIYGEGNAQIKAVLKSADEDDELPSEE